MIFKAEINDKLEDLTSLAGAVDVEKLVKFQMCSVDTPTTDTTTNADRLAEWVNDHCETRNWVIQAADLAAWTKEVLSTTIDAAAFTEITFIHIQAVSVPVGSNEAIEPCRFDWSINTGAGAVAMGQTSTISMSNMTGNVIQEIDLSNLVAVANRKVVVTVVVGINK